MAFSISAVSGVLRCSGDFDASPMAVRMAGILSAEIPNPAICWAAAAPGAQGVPDEQGGGVMAISLTGRDSILGYVQELRDDLESNPYWEDKPTAIAVITNLLMSVEQLVSSGDRMGDAIDLVCDRIVSGKGLSVDDIHEITTARIEWRDR